jgi:thioredoxin-related protein
MKACLWVVMVLCFALSSFAAPPAKPNLVRWVDYTEALKQAKDSNKIVFVDLYAEWCIPCRIMDANTYSDPTVASILNTKFIPVKLDVDSEDTISCDGKRKTVQRCYFDVWNLSVLPAFVLIAPKGLSIMTVKDSFTAEEMKYLLLQILDKEKEWISK